jgi:hypothetical protein
VCCCEFVSLYHSLTHSLDQTEKFEIMRGCAAVVLAVVLLTAPLCGSAKIVINTWGGPFTAATENGECQCISECV